MATVEPPDSTARMRLLAVLPAILVLNLLASPTAVSETYIKPRVASRAEYDSNPRLRPISEEEVLITRTDLELATRYARPTYVVSLTPRFRLSRYTEETDLDSEDYFVELTGQKLFARQQFSSEFNYEREASIETEQDDTGVFNVNVPRTSFSLNGSWLYAYTDKLNFTIYGNALDVSFGEDPLSSFVDYEQYGAGTSVTYALSDTTTILGNFQSSRFKTPSSGSETMSHAFQFGFESRFYETVRTSFRLGHNRSQIDFRTVETILIPLNPPVISSRFVNDTSRSAGFIADLFVEKKFERGELQLTWNRSFSPSSQGARQEVEEVSGFGRYRFSSRSWAEIRAAYRQISQEGQVSIRRINDNDLLRVTGRVYYRFSPSWRGEVGALFRERTRINTNTKADSLRVFFALNFTPKETIYGR